MKANQVKSTSPIKPLETGNKVFMSALPEYIEGDKGDAYKIKFIDSEGKVFEKQNLDPFSSDSTKIPDSLIQAGYKKIFDLYRAIMTTENYNQFCDIDFQDLKTCLATGNKMVATDWANTELTIILGNSWYNGYMDFPTFGDFISSKYATVELEYPHSQLSLKYVENPKVPRKAKAGATPDAETTKAKGNVNDDV